MATIEERMYDAAEADRKATNFEGLYTGNPSDRAFGKMIEVYNNETTRWGCVCAGVGCVKCPGSCEKCIYDIGEPGDYKNRAAFIAYAKTRGYVEAAHGKLVKSKEDTTGIDWEGKHVNDYDCPACLNEDCVEYREDIDGRTYAVCTICGRVTTSCDTQEEATKAMSKFCDFVNYSGSDSVLVRIKDLQRLFRMRKDFKPEDLKLMDLRYRCGD